MSAAVQRVVAAMADQDVVAIAAIEDIRAVQHGVQRIGVTEQLIGTGAAGQDVVAAAADQHIVAGTAIDDVVAMVRRIVGEAGADRRVAVDPVIAVTAGNRVVAAVAEDLVVAGTAGDRVGAVMLPRKHRRTQQIDLRIVAEDPVGALFTVDDVVVGIAEHDVVAVAGEHAVGIGGKAAETREQRRLRHPPAVLTGHPPVVIVWRHVDGRTAGDVVVTGAGMDPVIAVTTEQAVEAAAAEQRVMTALAADDLTIGSNALVRSRAAAGDDRGLFIDAGRVQRVVALATVDEILRRTALDGIGVRRTTDRHAVSIVGCVLPGIDPVTTGAAFDVVGLVVVIDGIEILRQI